MRIICYNFSDLAKLYSLRLKLWPNSPNHRFSRQNFLWKMSCQIMRLQSIYNYMIKYELWPSGWGLILNSIANSCDMLLLVPNPNPLHYFSQVFVLHLKCSVVSFLQFVLRLKFPRSFSFRIYYHQVVPTHVNVGINNDFFAVKLRACCHGLIKIDSYRFTICVNSLIWFRNKVCVRFPATEMNKYWKCHTILRDFLQIGNYY